jgi:tetratricopeptide (TPR) repeat protein
MLIQELLLSTKEYVSQRKYPEAISTLSEIIMVDPGFAEAYNKRATVFFGLDNSAECCADIEKVLCIEPLHYGALCGMGFLKMRDRDYSAALDSFRRAIEINPSLGNRSIGLHAKTCESKLFASLS